MKRIINKLTGGSDESEEELEQTLEERKNTAGQATEEEKEPVETIEFGDDNQYSLPEDKLTEVDETLQNVDDPVEFLSNKSAEGRQDAYDKSFMAEAFRREVTDEVRKERGAHQTARTTSLWAKNPNADELIEEVAADSGMEAEEIYGEMSSEEKQEMIQELVSEEAYSAADTLAVKSDGVEELKEVIESEIGAEIKENHEGENYVGANSLDKDEFNTVNALIMSLSKESYEEIDTDEQLGLNKFNKGKQLDYESKARMQATEGRVSSRSAKRAVQERWNNDEYKQAALLAETFEVDSVEVESRKSYEDEETIEDVTSEVIDDFRRDGAYEEAVDLASNTGRDELLEELAHHTQNEEEAFQVATAGYTEGTIMKQALEYVDNQVKEGNTDAYEQLNEAASYDIEDELSPEAQTDLKLAEL